MTQAEIDYSAMLMRTTNEILAGLKPGEIKGAINWGDLGCALVERVETFDGSNEITSAWRVIIEEAAPGSHELGSMVHKELSSLGYRDIEVQTDW